MFEESFCSSPWFHMRINNAGNFEECRWQKRQSTTVENISSVSVMEFYNSTRMRTLRQQLLDGESPDICGSCHYEDSHGKLSGRVKQLLKSGIRANDFINTTLTSPHYRAFLHSQDSSGEGVLSPVDLQIDLGNLCNSACVMCSPSASSKLHADYEKLHKISPILFKSPKQVTPWARDPEILARVTDELCKIPNLRYVHFLGGETLYNEAFYSICEGLIAAGVSSNVIVGTTTNGTVYDERVETLITKFKEFHLGVSIESVTSLNDYIRWPSKIPAVLENIDRFLALRAHSKLYVSLRITPNVFTVSEIVRMFEFMIDKNVIAESCNILFDPACLRIELLPENIRDNISQNLAELISKHGLIKTDSPNIRNSNLIHESIANVILEYKTFIDTYSIPADAETLRRDLVTFLKSFETLRGNSIIDYVPDYAEFLRTYGY